MKKMRPKSTQKCSYCVNRAVWRTTALSMQKYACNDHKKELEAYEIANQDDGYMTEADHQTWGRL